LTISGLASEIELTTIFHSFRAIRRGTKNTSPSPESFDEFLGGGSYTERRQSRDCDRTMNLWETFLSEPGTKQRNLREMDVLEEVMELGAPEIDAAVVVGDAVAVEGREDLGEPRVAARKEWAVLGFTPWP
jgi:hypothetical protein